MANEISSMVTASVTPAPAQKSGQSVKFDVTQSQEQRGEALPAEGQGLPQNSGKESDNSARLEAAVSQINDYVQSVRRDLSFSLDETSGRTVIRVMDSESGRLVRQIPSEEVLALANYLQGVQESNAAVNAEAPKGLLFSDTT